MSEGLSSETIHATCIALGGLAVLLCGRSGSGKSDLALRLIDRGASLVSDDYTILRRVDKTLVASAPATIAGKIEVRGIGIIEQEAISQARVALWVALDQTVERMPEDHQGSQAILGISVPFVALNAFESSAPLKVELALRAAVDAAHNEAQES